MVQAAKTKTPLALWFKQQKFLTVLKSGKSKIELPANSVPDEDSLPDLQRDTFFWCSLRSETEIISFMSLLIRALIAFMRAPP